MHIVLFNMGVPMIFPTMLLMIVGLLPIVFLEAYLISSGLGIGLRKSLKSVALANLVSTLFGIPITWFLLFIIQIISGGPSVIDISSFWGKLFAFTLQAPWLPPYGNADRWVFLAASLFLLIPFFFASWFVEYIVMKNTLSMDVYSARNEHPKSRNTSDGLKDIEIDSFEGEVMRQVRNANLASYAVLGTFLIALFLLGLVNQ